MITFHAEHNAWHMRDKEKARDYMREYRKTHKSYPTLEHIERLRQKKRERYARLAQDPEFRERHREQARYYRALRKERKNALAAALSVARELWSELSRPQDASPEFRQAE